MEEKLRMTGIESIKDLVIKDCPEFDFIVLEIETNRYRQESVKLNLDQITQLLEQLNIIKWDKINLKLDKISKQVNVLCKDTKDNP